MAEVVDDMPSKSVRPWDELLNGEMWVLKHGDDYHGDEALVAQRARSAAKRRKIRVEVCINRLRRVVYVRGVRE